MRYADGRKADTRAKVVETAGRLFRRDGIDATGVVGLMADAGLTKGGFYAHFPSKDALVAEAVDTALCASAASMRAAGEAAAPGARLAAFVEQYLSLRHVADRDHGCMIGSLLPELSRGSEAVREAAGRGAAGLEAVIAAALPDAIGAGPPALATAIFGTLVGCLQLARLERDEAAREAVLAAGRAAAYRLAGIAPPQAQSGASASSTGRS